jgi:hypothetical protein
MRRNTLNFVVDALALLAMLAMIATGLLTRYLLPPRHGTGVQRTLWGMDRHEWADVHFWIAVGLGALLVLHVALHWKWVCTTIRQLFQKRREPAPLARAAVRNTVGVAFFVVLVAIIAGFLWLAAAQVELDADRYDDGSRDSADLAHTERGWGSQRAGRANRDLHIRGSMTLAEAAETAGVTVEALRAALELPADTGPATRLSELRRDLGLEMSTVRETARRLREHSASQP